MLSVAEAFFYSNVRIGIYWFCIFFGPLNGLGSHGMVIAYYQYEGLG